MSKDQAKRLKSQVNDSKRNICDLKAKVRKICFNLVIFLVYLKFVFASKNAELESRIRDLEDEIKREETESHMLIENKDTELKYLQVELNKVMSEYEDLMASKSDLESEIMTYRKLLEGEENR